MIIWFDQSASRVRATMGLLADFSELERLVLSRPVQT
jgi:hypothetical protein